MLQLAIPPYLLLLALLALAYAALFHLWRGRKWSDLVVAFVAALVGLVAGQLLGPYLPFTFGRVGEMYILAGSVLAWLLMLAAGWLKG